MAISPKIQELKDVFFGNPPEVSFEFFPPKTESADAKLWETIKILEPLGPRFVSVTYGAGGSTRERTHYTVKRILRETSLTPAAHLTCVCANRAEIDAIISNYWEMGVRHIVALRGDPPEGEENYVPPEDGYHYSSDLVAAIKRIGDFDISVAAFPEKHPKSRDFEEDLDNLKRKLDAGATRAITQYFFDIHWFVEYVERVRKAGIDIPIVPGILPVSNVGQLIRFSAMCGATVPKWLAELFEGLDDDPTTRALVAGAVASEQCQLLHEFGINEFHFYTLNRADLTKALCRVLGIRPKSLE